MPTEDLQNQLRYLLDRIEIQDVILRYAIGQDSHQGDDGNILEQWDEVFTPDAVVDFTQSGLIKGSYKDLAKVMRGISEQPGFMPTTFTNWQHLLGVPTVHIHGDTATARTDLLATHTGKPINGHYWHLFSGDTFYDELVRTDRGWRIQFRRLEVHYVESMETLPRHEDAVNVLNERTSK